MTKLRFLNDVVKPWNELNEFLKMNFALQPDLSDVTRIVGQIAVSLRHQSEFSDLSLTKATQQCGAMQLLIDAGDYWKHGDLRDPQRNCTIYTKATFEYSEEGGFRFIRNQALLDHPVLGIHDFLEVSLQAIRFWEQHHGFDLQWAGQIQESTALFDSVARLKYDPRFCIEMSQTRIQILRKANDGSYQPYDPAEVRVEVY